jgi:UDP-2-acetamido-2,6-beta-L-arabino-hexul-4-ose reductase
LSLKSDNNNINCIRILITGARGFIGKNLVVRLREMGNFKIVKFNRGDVQDSLSHLVVKADCIIHLAGENRPNDEDDFKRVNTDLTETLCDAIRSTGRNIPVILASSTQAKWDNPYGTSKRCAEAAVERLSAETGNASMIYRLPGVFGKWCRPNYNSVVATFCYNIANDLPIQINDPDAIISLVHVDDVVDEFVTALEAMQQGSRIGEVQPEYRVTVGELAEQIRAFSNYRTTLIGERVGTGFVRALYSTYISYLPTDRFIYDIPQHGDERGVFVEMLKTRDSGQFSFFTAYPGITRGGHYHHTKTEKFLVIKGRARFGFRHILTGETYELFTSGDKPQIVETVPGWAHDITNIGDKEMVVMLWANEIFDKERPDTIAHKV